MNLQEGKTVIDLDSWWNPAAMDQALGRSYRIGQTRKVQHYIMSSPEVHVDLLMAENLKQKRILQKLIEKGDVVDCLKTLRNYIVESYKMGGLTLIEEEVDHSFPSLLASYPAPFPPLAPPVRAARVKGPNIPIPPPPLPLAFEPRALASFLNGAAGPILGAKPAVADSDLRRYYFSQL